MKLTKLVQVMIIGSSILMLAACSTTKKSSADSVSMNSADGGEVQASGMGDGGNFGGQGGGVVGPRASLSKRTYYFPYDRSEVRGEDKPAILGNADYLIGHTSAKITLEGHTDPRGSREYNVALGERRAHAVLDMMTARGVNPSQVRVVSYGAERLAVPGHTEDDYRMDRRVVLVYMQQ